MKTDVIGAEVELLHFPGGEPHARVKRLSPSYPVIIDARVRDFNDMGDLLCITDALRRVGVEKISLRLPYFPGARQDRALRGEALTAKVYTDLINAQGYESVTILDPHSPVVVALLERVRVASTLSFIRHYAQEQEIEYLVCPDAGGEKRTFEVSQVLKLPVVHARKHRDMRTGKLSGFSLQDGLVPGNYLIVDDICDGGGTFIGIAGEFPDEFHNAKYNRYLWVTHGIFSKGLEVLFTAYKGIGTTSSFYEGPADPRLSVYNLEGI